MTHKDGLREMAFRPSRRQLVSGMAALGVLAGGGARDAFGQAPKRIIVPEGNFVPMPIAIPNFVAGTPADGEVAVGVTQVITNNLKRSGLFAPIDQAAYIEHITNIDAAPQFANWKTINAQALVTGRMTRQGDGRLKAEFRLWDVATGQQLTGQQYFTSPEYWRRIAHIISDQIYERLTGEKGYFDSRVVFVDETGSSATARQAARVDGSGRRQCALPDTRRRPRADAAVFAVDPGNHLYGIRPGRPAGLPVQYRDRAARDRRQFPGHVVLAAVLAGRPARDHEPAAGRQFEPVRDGPAFEIDHAADRYAGDRYLAVLCAGRHRGCVSSPIAAASRRST